MSGYDYEVSRDLARSDLPFAALIMTAMRQADTRNLALLQEAFPELWRELDDRYHAPGGLLEGEARTPSC